MRRAAIEKIGYYPIPDAMMHWIVAQLSIAAGATISFIDPCMGEGAALKILKDQVKAHKAEALVYGCEISRQRYATALQTVLNERREGISRLVSGAAEFIDTSKHTFSLLYLNPPFDERGKEQNRWLELTEEWLVPGGWLIFITTEDSALRPDTQRLLDRCYEQVVCYRYPDAQRHFKEVVVFAKRRQANKREAIRSVIYTASSLATLTLQEQFSFEVPASKAPQRFTMTVPDLEDSLTCLHEMGISTTALWTRLTQSASLSSKWQPLLELGDGHIANLISSGAFDGMPIDDPDLGRCLITGYGTKEKTEPVVEVDEDGITEKETVTEIAVVHLVVMNIDTGELHKFSSRDPGRMESFILRHLHTLKAAIADTLKPIFDPETMLDAYLPYVPHFKAPGVLPGATRLRLHNGDKLRVKAKHDGYYLAQRDEGEAVKVLKSEVAHLYQNMLPAQIIKAAAMAYAMQHTTTSVIEVGQMGVGKTSTGMLTLYLYLAKQIERAMLPLKDTLQKLGELESDLLEAQRTGHRQHVRSLKEAIRLTEKTLKAMFKIVVVCPGHLVNKWAREATTNFSEMQIGGQKATVIIPGRAPHRVTHYELLGSRVVCQDCGAVADISLSRAEILKGLKLKDKLLRLSRLKCSNPECGHWLIQTYEDCAVEDIDNAFAAPGLTILVLSKEDAKLGANWEAAFIPKAMPLWDEAGHLQRNAEGRLQTYTVAQCPECGAIAMNRKGDEALSVEQITDPDKRKKYYCKGTVQRVKREGGKVVMEAQTFYVWQGRKYQSQHLPEGTDPQKLVKVTRMVPATVTERCGAPLFTFTRLGSTTKHSKISPKPRNRYASWTRGEVYPNHGSARWELAKVIARQHRGEYLLVIDECHMFKAQTSIQGLAVQWLIESATRTIALTGTIFGGKASSLFYLLYRLSPRFRETFGWKSVERFVDLFGVHEYITKRTRVDSEGTPSAYGAHIKKTERTDEGNGVDPSIVRWLLSIGVFLTLDDLGIELPEKQEQFHFLTPELELKAGLHGLSQIRQEAAKLAARGDFSLFSAWMQAALGWSLCPDQDEIYMAPEHRQKVAKLLVEGKVEEASLHEKLHSDLWASAVPFTPERPEGRIVQEIADACLNGWRDLGDRSVVYVSGVKRPANKHLYHAMKRRGLKPFILATPGDMEVVKWCAPEDFARCDLEDREAVITEALEHKDSNVLIVNPPLVATGLDLIAFNHLHFCGVPTYSVYLFEQAMCRLHRPGQQKKVTIHFWVYGWNPTEGNAKENELQALAMAVMSDKVRASAVVSGSVGAALAALNQTQGDIMNTLRELLLSGEADQITVAETSDQVIFKEALRVNPLYAKIEALVEQYDDARQPFVEASVPERFMPMTPVIYQPELTPATAEPLLVIAVEPASPLEPDWKGDPLLLLLADLGGSITNISNTVFAIQLQKPARSPKVKAPRRKRRVNLLDAPDDLPKPPQVRWLPDPCLDPIRETTPNGTPLMEVVQLELF
ncbi:MAG: DUF6094 domain-containing protein [Chloroflexota bacterium]